jgi:hypothetical protein
MNLAGALVLSVSIAGCASSTREPSAGSGGAESRNGTRTRGPAPAGKPRATGTTETTPMSCPPELVTRIQSADLTSDTNGSRVSSLPAGTSRECAVELIVGLAPRLDATSHRFVVQDWCVAVATDANTLSPSDKQTIRDAYLRFPYNESISLDYFNGLRYSGIDVRSQLAGKIPDDWQFSHPRKGAETWHYYKYLASLDQPGAYDALAAKLAATRNGNDLTNLVTDFAEIGTDKAKAIVLHYAGDSRRSNAPNGPGMTVAETVKFLLESEFAAT